MTESVGGRLRQARELRRLSIGQVSAATRIRSHYLEALEKDDLSSLPSTAQARGFLRIYTDFLGLHPDEISAVAHPESPAATSPSTSPLAEEMTSAPSESSPQASSASNALTRLRGLLKRRSESSSAGGENEGANPASLPESNFATALSEPFVPVRSQEEMPPILPPQVDESASLEKPTTKRPARRNASPARVTSGDTAQASGKGEEPASDILRPPPSGETQADLKKKSR